MLSTTREICDKIGEREGWGEDGNGPTYFSIDECLQEELHDMIRSQLISITWPIFAQIYFSLVLFTHYKNSELP